MWGKITNFQSSCELLFCVSFSELTLRKVVTLHGGYHEVRPKWLADSALKQSGKKKHQNWQLHTHKHKNQNRAEQMRPFLTQQQHPFMTGRRRERSHNSSRRKKEVVLLNGKEEKDVAAPPTPSSTYFPPLLFLQKQSARFLLWHSTSSIHLPPSSSSFSWQNHMQLRSTD